MLAVHELDRVAEMLLELAKRSSAARDRCLRIPRPADRPNRPRRLRRARADRLDTSSSRTSGTVRVSIGWRPAGFSRSSETSMSPK
jgi:hypothetical protein